MNIFARTPQQLGAAIRRVRRQRGLSQIQLGHLMHVRQATVSQLEAGHPGTMIRTIMDALAALDLEITVHARSTKAAADIEELF